jgi:5'-nucleotidase
VPRKILYVDLDNTLVDFASGIGGLDPTIVDKYEGRLDEAPGIFALMRPLPGAIDAFRQLAGLFDIYILSTAPWLNPSVGNTRSNGYTNTSELVRIRPRISG